MISCEVLPSGQMQGREDRHLGFNVLQPFLALQFSSEPVLIVVYRIAQCCHQGDKDRVECVGGMSHRVVAVSGYISILDPLCEMGSVLSCSCLGL